MRIAREGVDMPGALPLLLVAILNQSGSWQVATTGTPAPNRPLVAGGHRALMDTGQVTGSSIVVRGQHSRGAMPATVTSALTIAAPEEQRVALTVVSGPTPTAPPAAVRARGPPATSA